MATFFSYHILGPSKVTRLLQGYIMALRIITVLVLQGRPEAIVVPYLGEGSQ